MTAKLWCLNVGTVYNDNDDLVTFAETKEEAFAKFSALLKDTKRCASLCLYDDTGVKLKNIVEVKSGIYYGKGVDD